MYVLQLTSFIQTSLTIGTAESLTGGAIAKAISSVPGSSRYFRGAIVAYAEDVKVSVLGVNEQTIADKGVVSEEVVAQMAQGCRKVLNVDFAIATSGIAGPDGGTVETPVGTVCISIAGPGFCESWTTSFEGDRNAIVEAVVRKTFDYIEETVKRHVVSVG